jgi:Protein of unknown function (DUF2459)
MPQLALRLTLGMRVRLASAMPALLFALLLGFISTEAAEAGPALHPPLVYVVRRGWHIDIGFAAADLQPPLRSILSNFPPVGYVFFGFGDMHYLVAKSHGPLNMAAALWPGAAIVLVTTLANEPQEAFGATQVISLLSTSRQTRLIQDFIWKSLVTSETTVEPFSAGPYAGGYYFAARPRYSALHTCNTWVAQTLRAGEFPVHSAGVVFAGQLWTQVRRLGRTQSLAVSRRSDSTQASGSSQGFHSTEASAGIPAR